MAAIGVLAGAAAVYWFLYGADSLPGRVTAYYAACLRRASDRRCTVVGRTFAPAVFRVSAALQRVESIDEKGEIGPLRACEVVSKDDWRCRSASDDSFELGFSGGRPWFDIDGSAAPDLVFLPRWRYLWLKSGERYRDVLPNRFQLRP